MSLLAGAQGMRNRMAENYHHPSGGFLLESCWVQMALTTIQLVVFFWNPWVHGPHALPIGPIGPIAPWDSRGSTLGSERRSAWRPPLASARWPAPLALAWRPGGRGPGGGRGGWGLWAVQVGGGGVK